MINTLIGIGAAALLFALFGVFYRHKEECGGGCGGCARNCVSREEPDDKH